MSRGLCEFLLLLYQKGFMIMRNILLYLLIAFSCLLAGERFFPIDNVIKHRQTYYDLNGSVPVEVSKREIDLIKASGVILNAKTEAKLKGKKSPEELRASMAVFKYGEHDTASNYVRTHLKKPKRSHIFIIIKKEKQQVKPKPVSYKKSTMLKKLYYGE